MAHLEYFSYEGFGDRVRKETYYSQAVRVGDIIEVSGQGGWDRKTEVIPSEIDKEVDQAFDNIQHALQQAGSKGWEQVYKVRIYMAPLDMNDAAHIVRNLRKYCPDHQPLLTCVGAHSLAFETMHIEIEVAAHLGQK